ncbi:MAG: heavy metal-binding domain-containing protein [Planctomycetota bacterium]
MALLFQLGAVLLLLGLGFFVGGYVESRHFKRLDAREAEAEGFLVTQLKSIPGGAGSAAASTRLPPQIFMAEAVIASDYLKTFLSGVRKFFGGEMRSYQTLLERARREALMRIVEQARDAGYDAAYNLRYETADIGGATSKQRRVVTVAVLATATAYCREPVA